jgi:hypothetical protein
MVSLWCHPLVGGFALEHPTYAISLGYVLDVVIVAGDSVILKMSLQSFLVART